MTTNKNDGVFISARVSRHDLIYSLNLITRCNPYFDIDQWSESEIDDLRLVSRFLDKSLADLKKHLAEKQLSSGENHPVG